MVEGVWTVRVCLTVAAILFSADASIIKVHGSVVHGRLDGDATLRYSINLDGRHLRTILCFFHPQGTHDVMRNVYLYRQGERGVFFRHLVGRAREAIQGNEFSITIEHLRMGDFGNYSCNFHADTGSSTTAISTLIKTDKILQVRAMPTNAAVGETAWLRYVLNIDGEHLMESIWCFFSPSRHSGLEEVYMYRKNSFNQFSGRLADGRAQAEFILNHEHEFAILIHQVSPEDEGTYSCNFHAINTHTTAVASLTVHNRIIGTYRMSTAGAVMLGIAASLLVFFILILIYVLTCRRTAVKRFVGMKWKAKSDEAKDKLVEHAEPPAKKVAVIHVDADTNLMRY